MPVDSIGSVTGGSQTDALANSKTINQDDFIKLFLAQLRFQDPMEPVDNREFLAQLAQFSSLEQSRQTSQNTSDLLTMNSATQAVSLLNRQVDVQGLATPMSGTVIAVAFTTSGPTLSVKDSTGAVTTDIRLSQVTLVKP